MKKFLKTCFIIIIAIFIISAIMNRTNAENLSIEDKINNLINENEDNPESTKYLVTDTTISRVMPGTSIETFKTDFASNEVVKVYTNSECNEQDEIKNGIIYSGMYAKYEYNGRKFKISVLGDIHSEDKLENNLKGDGLLNQIELTRIIREHVKTIGWSINDEIEKLSADINIDKNINDKDIKSVITYIVFEGLERKNVKKVDSPVVDVISGKQDGEGFYNNSVKLKIYEQNSSLETQKTIYKITKVVDEIVNYGEYIKMDTKEKEVNLTGKGTYIIKAYTYGIEGNKSKIETKVIKIKESRRCTISGEAKAHGQINGSNSFTEIVNYGEDSQEDIIITPNTGYEIDTIKINNEKLSNYEEIIVKEKQQNSTRIIRKRATQLDKFKNVIEDKNIVVTFKKAKIVAKITATPDEYKELRNTEYEFLADALESIPEGEEGNFVIQIVEDIKEDGNIIDNKEVTIDLNGHEVKAEDDIEANITVKSGGKLTIIDDTDEKTGKIVNTKGISIKIESGTFTLGTNEIEGDNVPDELPCIQGETIGIKNEEGGIFNFYDGIIKGKNSAIDGAVSNTPNTYNSTISTNSEIKEATLKRTQVIEARIGSKNYFQFETAIDEANRIIGNSNEQVEIILESDISRGNTKIEINNTKNIILNINGHTITSTSDETVLENAGKLVIADTNDEEKGKIKSQNSYAIVNKDNANLEIKDGINIEVDINGYGINNKDSAKCILTNCNIQTNESTSNEGKLIKGRTIINNSSIQGIEIKEVQILDYSEIYNTGNMIVSGGTGENTNIVNDEEGNIVINGGTYKDIKNSKEIVFNDGILGIINNLQDANIEIKGRKMC